VVTRSRWLPQGNDHHDVMVLSLVRKTLSPRTVPDDSLTTRLTLAVGQGLKQPSLHRTRGDSVLVGLEQGGDSLPQERVMVRQDQ